MSDHPREVAEAALAHKVGSRIEAAYRRSDLFERRHRLMDDWAVYLAGPSREPQARAALDGLPARDHCGGSDPETRGGKGGQRPGHLSPRSWRTSAEKPGVAPSTSSPSRRSAPGEAGTRRAPPRHGCRRRRGESVPTRVP